MLVHMRAAARRLGTLRLGTLMMWVFDPNFPASGSSTYMLMQSLANHRHRCTDTATVSRTTHMSPIAAVMLCDQVAGWPSEKLHIMAEHSAIFTDLFSDSRVSSVFNPKGPHARAFKYFRYGWQT